MATVKLEATSGGSLDKLEGELRDVERQLRKLESVVKKLSGKPLDLPTDPAEADIKRLVSELAKLENAFKRAQANVRFQAARNEIEKTEQSARRLANANAVLAARAKEVIDTSRRLPPALQKSSAAMDRLERQTEEAASAFRAFRATAAATGAGLSSLLSSVNGLRAGLAGVVAALGIGQIIRFGRAIIRMGAAAVEVKKDFDRLIPGLKAFTGSTELAEEVADRLAVTADKLKTPLAALINPFLGISSGGREAGLSIAQINDLFEASLTAARAFGKGATEVQRLLTGISQVAGKGVASMEEFRQQIGEAIPNAIPALAKGLGVTVPVAIEKISSGTLLAKDALIALTSGFFDLNAEAAKGQLNTLAGDIGSFQRATEEASVALADELEPGLRLLITSVTDLINTNPTLIKQLGSLGSVFLTGLTGVSEGLEKSAGGLEIVGAAALDVANKLRELNQVPGTEVLEGLFRKLGNVLFDVGTEADKAFKAIEEGAEKAATGAKKSAEEILEEFTETFTSNAEAAGTSAEIIEKIQRTLADRVGAISERTFKARVSIERLLRKEFEETGRISIETQESAFRVLFVRAKTNNDALIKLQQELAAEAKAFGIQRVEDERKVAAEIATFVEGIVEAARAASDARIAAGEITSDRISEIERKTADRILAIATKLQEDLLKTGADREKLAAQAQERITKISVDGAARIIKAQEQIAEATEKAAERRIKAEEKARAAIDSSITKLREILKVTNEIADGAEGEGGGFERQREQVQGLAMDLGDLLGAFETFGASPFVTEVGQSLDAGFAGLAARLDITTAGFGDFFTGATTAGQAASDLGSNLSDDLGTALADTLGAIRGLPEGARDAVADLVQEFAKIADAGTATVEDARAFKERLGVILGDLGGLLDVGPIQAGLDALRESLASSTEAAEDAAAAQEEAGEVTGAAYDEATKTIRNVEEATKDVGTAAEDTSGKIVESIEDGVKSFSNLEEQVVMIVEAISEAGDAIEEEDLGKNFREAKTDAEGLTTAVDGTTTGVQALATATEPLGKELIPEGQVERLRQLGVAASEVAPQIQPLAAPIAQIAEKLLTFADSLPTIATQIPLISGALPQLQESVTALLQAITENPIDLAGIATSLESIDTALASVSKSTSTLKTILPDLQAALEPLFEAALKAADDDRLGKIAEALEEMARAAPQIPEPIRKLAESLKAITKDRDETVEAIGAIRVALEALSSPELEKRLDALVEVLKDVQKKTGELAADAARIRSELVAIEDVMPRVVFQLDFLAESLTSKVLPAVAEVRDVLKELNEQLGAIPGAALKAAQGLMQIQDIGVPAIDAATAAALRLTVQLKAAEDQAIATATAMAQIAVP